MSGVLRHSARDARLREAVFHRKPRRFYAYQMALPKQTIVPDIFRRLRQGVALPMAPSEVRHPRLLCSLPLPSLTTNRPRLDSSGAEVF